MSRVKIIREYPANINRSRIVIRDPGTKMIICGRSSAAHSISQGRYLDENGTECELWIRAPKQMSEVCPIYSNVYMPKNSSATRGLRICYPVVVENPTLDEQDFMDLLRTLKELTVEKCEQVMEKEADLLPDISVLSYTDAKTKKQMDLFVKPPTERSGAVRYMFVGLLTSGKGRDSKTQTKFYDSEGKQVPPLDCVNNLRGIIEPWFRWDGVYWGEHGRTSYGASLRFTLVEAVI